MKQDAYLTALRLALNERTGRTWSLRKGRGSSHANVYVTSPTERKRPDLGTLMNADDRVTLGLIFGLPVDTISDMVVITPEQYEHYLARAQRE